MIIKKMKSTIVLLMRAELCDLGLVNSMTFLTMMENRALVMVEMMAATICSPFST